MPKGIPAALWSPLGPTPVRVSKTLIEDKQAFGMTQFRPRVITIDSGGCQATQVATLWHEAVHIALWDGGVHNVLSHKQTEAVCDAVGSYLGAMQLAGCLTVRAPK